jgi:DNA repair exonuclease SbcCD nuclease subunit
MSINLFKKAAVCGDSHLGLKSNSIIHLGDCVDFFEWFIETAKKNDCDSCIFLGDFFHNRNSINLVTLTAGINIMRRLNDNFKKVYVMIGNHDCYFKQNRDIHSIEWMKDLPNIEIINEISCKGNCLFLPWLVGEEYKTISSYKAKYVFGHLELPGYIMSGNNIMPDIGELDDSHFNDFDMVFSGHFHKRQQRGNVHYIGNTFPHNYGDANDNERGMMLLEWDKEPEYISWPNAPKYKLVLISDLVTDPAYFLEPNSYVKLWLDTDTSYEEASYLKENLVKEFNLRELILVSIKKDIHSDDAAPNSNIQFQSVETIVINQISEIKSEFFDTNLLLDLYRGLS